MAVFHSPLPASYLKRCKISGRKPISVDYALWWVNRGGHPAVVPGHFTTDHLDQLPEGERKRWLQTARRRYNAKKRKAA